MCIESQPGDPTFAFWWYCPSSPGTREILLYTVFTSLLNLQRMEGHDVHAAGYNDMSGPGQCEHLVWYRRIGRRINEAERATCTT